MRIEQITFTRFIASISIVIFHFGKEVFPFNNQLVSFFFKQAYVGVSYFFILSGFVMIIAYANKSNIKLIEFLKNRLYRIYPVYLLAVLILLLFNVITQAPMIYTGILLNLFVIQAWIPGEALSFNAPGWSLCVEFFFYSLFPFLLRLYSKKPLKVLVLPIISFWLLSQLVLHLLLTTNTVEYPSKLHDLVFYFPLMHLNEFLIGNLTGLFFLNKVNELRKNYDWCILGLILLIIISLNNPVSLNFHNGLLALLFVPLIILISLSNGRLTSITKLKFFVFLGEISFGIYILQFPIFTWTSWLFVYLKIANPLIEFYVSALILILVSAISYIYIESPLRRLSKISSNTLFSAVRS